MGQAYKAYLQYHQNHSVQSFRVCLSTSKILIWFQNDLFRFFQDQLNFLLDSLQALQFSLYNPY